MKGKLRWAKDVTEDDYLAAQRYLSLIAGRTAAMALSRALRAASFEYQIARDLMRAADYQPRAPDNKKQRKDIKDGEKLTPFLVVRDILGRRLIIADGYHRIGAICAFDDKAEVPCKIVDLQLRAMDRVAAAGAGPMCDAVETTVEFVTAVGRGHGQARGSGLVAIADSTPRQVRRSAVARNT